MNNKDLINQINWMKDDEKRFFKFCCKRIEVRSVDQNYPKSSYYVPLYNTCFRDLVMEFHEKYGTPINRLYYYVTKWDSMGMVDYGVNVLFGWFVFGYKTPARYVVLMPDRIYKKLYNSGVRFSIEKERR